MAIVGKMLGELPLSDVVAPVVDKPSQNQSLRLRTQIDFYIPFVVIMMQKEAQQNGKPKPSIDPNALLASANQEITELSDANIHPAFFEISKNFTATDRGIPAY
jgi:hypothetical protein